ncbi:MAG TPA: hypothetical protein VG496_16000 [Myxococcales bacterium]|nr:hypothetical protein [Myxococcales bacterium]
MTPVLSVGMLLSLAASTAAPAGAEGSGPASTLTAVPSVRYEAGWFKRLLLGGHWRDAWNTPIEVPVVNLDTFDGGLSPERQGGGVQTVSLHFKSAAGRTWVFRSVDKDPTRSLDPDSAEGWIGDFTQDTTSSLHPAAPLIVAPLLEAVGVLHATPQLAVLPDDPRLGEFRARFAGMLGTLEERIEHHIPGVDKVEDTFGLFERLDRRSDERVDARDYLRSRLVDILVGDWDRHTDQYRWVRVRNGDERVWRVVPRDHDQAFCRFDGAVPSMIEYYDRATVGWGDTYPPIEKLTFRGRYTDRRFLVSLERAEWEAVTEEVVGKLTDAVIEDAVHRLPPPLYAETGEGLARALRSRRDRLAEASREYYRLLAHDVDVRGTTSAEDFQVDRGADGSVAVAIFARVGESGEREAAPRFHRTFRPDETSEIRLYTMGGRDRVIEQGNGTSAILLRIIEPTGTAEILDSSPQRSATKIYAPAAPPPDEVADSKERERMRYKVFRDWGSNLLIIPQLSYDPTRGVLLGAYAWRTGYGFGLDPFASDQKLGAAWSTGLSRPRIEYGAKFRTRTPLRGLLYAAYSGIEQAKFFGFGNETVRDSSSDSRGFYDVRQDQIVVNPMVEATVAGSLSARVGAEFKHVWSVDQRGLIEQLQPAGAGGMSVGSAQAGLLFVHSTGTYPLLRSISAEVLASVAPAIFSNPATFGKVRGSVTGTYGAHVLTDVQLSAGVSGERNFGTYPFFEAAFAGGTPSKSALDVTGATRGHLLRGYDLNRFAGDAAVVANTDVDIEIGKYSAFLPLRYGVFGLFDVGRVFVDGESSSKWHTGAGGGVWLGLFALSPSFSFTGMLKAAVVRSDEGTSFYVLSAFPF